MNEEYLLKTIEAIISTHENGLNYVHINELRSVLEEDMKMAVNQLIIDKRIRFQRDVNGNPIFFINEGVD